MASTAYDADRISKISQIMPQFSEVARPGDRVVMGLEGDPLYPYSSSETRPGATITDTQKVGNEYLIDLQMGDGSTKQVSSYTLSPTEVWEYTDDAFRGVLDRETPVPTKPAEYRNSDNNLLTDEISQLRSDLAHERQTTREFHNTFIATLHELASDVCKLASSTGEDAKFCKTFNNEYKRMMSSREETIETDSDSMSSASDSEFY